MLIASEAQPQCPPSIGIDELDGTQPCDVLTSIVPTAAAATTRRASWRRPDCRPHSEAVLDAEDSKIRQNDLPERHPGTGVVIQIVSLVSLYGGSEIWWEK
jgi:hypothetical protein